MNRVRQLLIKAYRADGSLLRETMFDVDDNLNFDFALKEIEFFRGVYPDAAKISAEISFQ